jgi:hypothetical protein
MNYKQAYDLAVEELGIQNLPSAPPPAKYMYYAYKNGTCSIFETEKTAKEFSYIIERFQVNKEEISQYWNTHKKISQLAENIWYKALEETYKHLSPEMFEACYGEAYDRGHSAGWDEVVYYMDEVVSFANTIKTIVEKQQ